MIRPPQHQRVPPACRDQDIGLVEGGMLEFDDAFGRPRFREPLRNDKGRDMNCVALE